MPVSRWDAQIEQIPQVGIYYNGHLKVHSSLLNVVLCDKPEIKTENVRTMDRRCLMGEALLR